MFLGCCLTKFGNSLYRRILRAHRSLPQEMRSLGDDYVKAGLQINTVEKGRALTARTPCVPTSSEFRRHKDVTNKVHIIGFLSQWKVYLDELPAGPEAKGFTGKKLDPTVLEKVYTITSYPSAIYLRHQPSQMSAEQLGQLYELMNVTKEVWKPSAPSDAPERS